MGIDPGNNGAAVTLAKRSGKWWLDRVFRLSSGELAISNFITQYTPDYRGLKACYLEQVHGWGEARSFNFGMYYGFVRGSLYTRDVTEENGRLINVTPLKWMKEMGVPPQKGQKALHRQAMRELAGELQNEVEATNWNAAAILIALYGLRQEEGVGLC
jgi:hypothetical protein